jgi:hypothetical protein
VKNYVLIIYEASSLSGEGVYRKVGVALLKLENVASEGSWGGIRLVIYRGAT